ncbi:MAG: site-2 protease family protein [Clostridia bacterium]|nr:site-2 protease family protein [Clostridia bacterium]
MALLSLNSVLNTAVSVLLAVLILLGMITVHEFGHYLAGKAFGFKINEFAIGFGPALYKRTGKKSGEVFSVRALPLGGYCAFEGEDDEGKVSGPVRLSGGLKVKTFNEHPPWQRIIVLVSGALMNYIAAVIIIIASFLCFGQMALKINGVIYDETYTQSQSFVAGDVILQADGRDIYLTADLMTALAGKEEGDIVAFTVSRNGESEVIYVTLRRDCDFENSSEASKLWSALGADTEVREDGVAYWTVGVVNYRFGFFKSIGRAFSYSFKIAGTIFKVLGELLTGSLGLDAVGGPVTTVMLTSQIASQGVQSFLEIAAYIGVNLAVFNLLPIPALDGSKVIFCLIEWIFKKPVPRKVEAAIHAAGFVAILLFAILVDILQFV